MMKNCIVVRNTNSILSAMMVAVALAGCSSGEPTVKLVPVTGKVTMDGSALAGANVTFIPKDQTKGTGGFGATDEQGGFELRHLSNKPGVQVGSYKVVFSKIAMPDGSPIPPDRSAADMGAIETLPPQLSSPLSEDSPHTATVTESGGSFDFKLTSK